MATLLAHITVVPGAEDRFEQVALELHRRTHADETAVRRYEYWRGAEPGTYYCLESFPDLHGFYVHQTSPHHDDAGPKLNGLIADMWLEWVDPIAAASPLAATNTVELPDGASEAMQVVHERFHAVEAAWWGRVREVAAGLGLADAAAADPGSPQEA